MTVDGILVSVEPYETQPEVCDRALVQVTHSSVLQVTKATVYRRNVERDTDGNLPAPSLVETLSCWVFHCGVYQFPFATGTAVSQSSWANKPNRKPHRVGRTRRKARIFLLREFSQISFGFYQLLVLTSWNQNGINFDRKMDKKSIYIHRDKTDPVSIRSKLRKRLNHQVFVTNAS